MPTAYEGLSAVQVGAALDQLRKARDRVVAIIASKQTPGGVSASDYDLFVAAQLKGAIEKEIATLEAALLVHAGKTASASAALATKHYSADVAKHGVAPVGVDARTIAFAADVAGEKIRAVSSDVKAKVRAAITLAMAGGLSRAELVAKVSDAVAGKRTAAGVERIIRTEVGTAYEQSQVAADKQVLDAGGDLIKRWRALDDARTRDDHLAIDGQERELDEFFSVGQGATDETPAGGPGFPANAPHDPTLPADEVINCRCFVERIPRAAKTQPYIAETRPQQGPAAPPPKSDTGGRGALPRGEPGRVPEPRPVQKPEELPALSHLPEPAPPPAPSVAGVSSGDIAAAEALAIQANALGAGGHPPTVAPSPPAPAAPVPAAGVGKAAATSEPSGAAPGAVAVTDAPLPPPATAFATTKTPAAPHLVKEYPPGTPLLSPTGKTGYVKSIAPSGKSATVTWDNGKSASVFVSDVAKWSAAAKAKAPAPVVPAAAVVKPTQSATSSGPPPPDGEAVLDATKWKQVGPQSGSNPGGLFEDESGTRWYVKQPATADHANNEVLASKLYGLAGVEVPALRLVKTKVAGKVGYGVASRWIDGVELATSSAAFKAAPQKAPGLAEGFAADAWLANHDVTGLTFDNLGLVNGKVVRLDVGGALLYRAQGAPKGEAFGESALPSLGGLQNGKTNPQAASVFGNLSIDQKIASIERVTAIPDEAIRDAVMKFGPGTIAQREALAAKLVARRDSLVAEKHALEETKVELANAAAAAKAKAAPPPPPAPAKEPRPVEVGATGFDTVTGQTFTVKKVLADGQVVVEWGTSGVESAPLDPADLKITKKAPPLEVQQEPPPTAQLVTPSKPHPHAPDPAGPTLEVGLAVMNAKGKVGTIASYTPGKVSASIEWADGSESSVWADAVQAYVTKAKAKGVTGSPTAPPSAPAPASATPATSKDAPPAGSPTKPWGGGKTDLEDLPPASASGADLSAKVKAAKHSSANVKAGTAPAGIDFGSGEWQKAKDAGLFATEVVVPGGSPVKLYAKSAEAAKWVVAYLKAGGQVGTPQLSALLGYTKQEVADYKAWLLAQGKTSLASAKPIALPADPPVPKVEKPLAPGVEPLLFPTTSDPRLASGKPWEREVGQKATEVAHPKNANAWALALQPAEASVLRSYTGSGYSSMNRTIRDAAKTGSTFLDTPGTGETATRKPKTETEREAVELQRALMRGGNLKEPKRFYRGVAVGDTNDTMRVLGLDQGVGSEVVLHGFVSTSTKPRVASAFGGTTLTLEIVTKSGASVLKHTSHGSEYEWLLPSGLRYRVVGYEHSVDLEAGGTARMLVKLEEVTP